QVIAADGERVTVATEHEHVQIRARQRNAAGKWQGAAVDVVRAMGLDEIRKAARATDASDSGDLFMPDLAFFNQLEIKREHGKIAATRAPGWMIGGHLFLGQADALTVRHRSDRGGVQVPRAWENFKWNGNRTHKEISG